MMTFANVEDVAGYVKLLSGSGCEVRVAEDTGRFPSHIHWHGKRVMHTGDDGITNAGYRLIKPTQTFRRISARWISGRTPCLGDPSPRVLSASMHYVSKGASG